MSFKGTSTYVTAAVVTAGAVGGAYCAYHLYKKSQKPKLPTEWTEVGHLKDLYAYPIKSCAPIILNQAVVTTLGLKDGWMRDRILMVVDEKNNFITARAYPEMLLVQPEILTSTNPSPILTLNHPQMEPVSVNLAEVTNTQKPKPAVVWGVQVPVYDCGWEASEWFSRLLDRTATSFRLVYYASSQSRALRPSTNEIYKFTKDDTGALPDEVPYNLINEASVEDLDHRVSDCRVRPQNFRPNFVLAGAKAYDEDYWKFVKIGDNIFEIIKPCFRCILTTIDPETGVRHEKQEPLETLKTYRQSDDPAARRSAGTAPRMGLQMALRSAPGGVIAKNDRIYVA
ncbi:mitochondrial amidoxime-reducing component 1 isoform X2 [Bicyclus anynana]|uniref:Mitochondrial amidoxime-reducing component 1 isoform X2 n=1 Tax=Bicyclus anynana TaxID=110368 RepID=A0A6J1MWK5_BICAN|nr:mitochondrial amidoxime-reducing component 1 isoform X2 [Bicyclus anynana]